LVAVPPKFTTCPATSPAHPRKVHVVEERGDRTLICWISYPATSAIREVSASSVYTDFAVARRAD
jgi:uncharacterized protein (DUF1330 family)